MIVKIQKAIAGPGGILIYAKGRKNMREVDETPAIKRLLGGKLKAFAHAEFKQGQWVLGQSAPEQNW